MKYKNRKNNLEVSMNRTEQAIISELVAFGLDSDLEAIVTGLDDYNIDVAKVKKLGEEFIMYLRHRTKT